MRTYIAIATLALVAACGGSGDVDAQEVPEVTQEAPQEAQGAASEAPEPPVEGSEWVAEYEAPGEVIERLQAAGIECEPGEVTSPTMASKAAQDCYVNADETDFYGVDVYSTPAQQGEAHVYLTEMNPGSTRVWGTGWSVKVPTGSDGSEVVDVLGGEVG